MSDNPQTGPLVSLGRTLIRLRVTVLALITVLTAFFGYHAVQLRLQSRFGNSPRPSAARTPC
jgi:hypothetical protein